jgi:hypothetical protein
MMSVTETQIETLWPMQRPFLEFQLSYRPVLTSVASSRIGHLVLPQETFTCPLDSIWVEGGRRFLTSKMDTMRESIRRMKPINPNIKAIDLTYFRSHKCLFPT